MRGCSFAPTTPSSGSIGIKGSGSLGAIAAIGPDVRADVGADAGLVVDRGLPGAGGVAASAARRSEASMTRGGGAAGWLAGWIAGAGTGWPAVPAARHTAENSGAGAACKQVGVRPISRQNITIARRLPPCEGGRAIDRPARLAARAGMAPAPTAPRARGRGRWLEKRAGLAMPNGYPLRWVRCLWGGARGILVNNPQGFPAEATTEPLPNALTRLCRQSEGGMSRG